MKNKTLHRHDISDRAWEIIEPYLPGRAGTKSRPAKDNLSFINAVIWNNRHRRFTRRRDKGIWEKLFEIVKQDPDFEWLMTDASYVKVHPHGTGARNGNQDMGRTKGGSTQKSI